MRKPLHPPGGGILVKLHGASEPHRGPSRIASWMAVWLCMRCSSKLAWGRVQVPGLATACMRCNVPMLREVARTARCGCVVVALSRDPCGLFTSRCRPVNCRPQASAAHPAHPHPRVAAVHSAYQLAHLRAFAVFFGRAAYDTMSRESFLTALQDAAPSLLPFVRFFYGRTSIYYWWDDRGGGERCIKEKAASRGTPLLRRCMPLVSMPRYSPPKFVTCFCEVSLAFLSNYKEMHRSHDCLFRCARRLFWTPKLTKAASRVALFVHMARSALVQFTEWISIGTVAQRVTQ